ncbi:MAG: hypothetical protein MK299_07500 [Pseudomonadales bacterium]|jgi:hypothetical protein|nr:hypothetical protein [Pseudomonadales bacterium]
MNLARKITIIAIVGLFSQFSMAQDNASAIKEVADIVASINHFPSDADKDRLMAISDDDSLFDGIRAMATAVSNFAHAANADGKAAMASLQANDQIPDRAKALAGIIGNMNHTASADAKATLGELFP